MKCSKLLTLLLVIPLLASCSVLDKISGGSTCNGPVAYVVGTTMAGTTGNNDCRGPTGATGQLYAMTLSQQSSLQLTVATTAFQPYIGLYTEGGKVISENLTDGKIRAFLPAGNYQVLVGKATGSDGSFQLTSPPAALGGCTSTTGSLSTADYGVTAKGASFAGTITSTDCGALNAKMHVYLMHLTGVDTLVTTVTVDHTAGLYLFNSTGATIVNKEMASAGTWSYTYASTTDGVFTLRLETRSPDGKVNLPLGYSVVLK